MSARPTPGPKPSASGSVFERLSSPASSSTRSTGSLSSRSPTTARIIPASPKRMPPPKTESQKTDTDKKEKVKNDQQAQADVQASSPPPPAATSSSSTAASSSVAAQPQNAPPPAEVKDQPEDRPSAEPAHSQDPAPAKVPPTEKVVLLSQDEQDKIREWTATRDERRTAVAAVEEALLGYALKFKASNATERAAQFQKRTEETQSENKMMRKDIDLLRNADRVMVSLRDTVDTMKKHQRIRTAHIRQKIATIELIAKRCREQRAERVKLLDMLEASAVWIDTLAVDELNIEQRSFHVDPLRNLAFFLRRDGTDEEFIETTIRDMAQLSERHAKATAALEAELARLQSGIATASGDSTVLSDEIAADWEDTKSRMLCEYQRLCALNDELNFHVRRGTHIKTAAQLPELLHSDEERLRELALAVSEAQEAAKTLKRRCVAAQDQLRRRDESESVELEHTRLALEKSAIDVARLQNANHAWRQRYTELQQDLVNQALGDATFCEVRQEEFTEPESPPTARRTGLPAAEVTSRLFSTLTKSRQAAAMQVAAEDRDRKLRSAAMRLRPVPAKQ